jgi:phytoene desaturase
MPEVLEALFARAGERLADHVALTRLDLQCRYLFRDGRVVDFHDDEARTLESIAACEPADAPRFRELVQKTGRMYEVVGRPFLEHPYDGFSAFSRVVTGNPLEAMKWGALQGMLGDIARRSLKSERLRWIVHRYATYAGGGPARTPASFATIVHVETKGGAFYPRGGIYALVEAVAGLARRVGVKIETGADVERIEAQGGAVTGLRVGGASRRFDAVVSNADPVFVAERLLDPASARAAGLQAHVKQGLGLSGFVLMLGVKGRLEHLAHHTVLFPPRYDPEFADLFDRDRMPEEPTVYLCIPSRTDPTRAPDGCESVFAMINAPANAHRVDWAALAPVAVERIKKAIEYAVPGLRARIVAEHVRGPGDLLSMFHAPGGSIYGVSPHGRLSPFHRPLARSKLKGLYFSGGGTHPGGGIPLVVRSGQFAAQLLAQDLGAPGARAA